MTAADQPAAPADKPNKKATAVGSPIEIQADGPTVEVTLPDGSTVVVHARNGRALYVLDRPGVHHAAGLTFEAKA